MDGCRVQITLKVIISDHRGDLSKHIHAQSSCSAELY